MLYLYFLLYIVYLIIYRKNKTVGGVCSSVGGVCSSVGVSPGVGGHISDGARQGGRGQNTSVAAQCCSRMFGLGKKYAAVLL